MTVQNIIGGGFEVFYASQTRYDHLNGASGGTTSTNARQSIISTPGFLSKLRCVVDTAAGAGKSYICTLMVNNVATNLVATLANTTSMMDTEHRVHVNQGDAVKLRFTTAGSPANGANTKWSCVFESDKPNESLILGGMDGNLDYLSGEFGTLMGCSDWTGVTANTYGYNYFPSDGYLKDLYMNLGKSPGSGCAYTFSLHIEGADTALKCIMSGTDTVGTDLVNQVRVARGNRVALHALPFPQPLSGQYTQHWGVTFVSDRPGESVFLHNSNNAPDNTATEWIAPNSRARPRWGEGTEAATKRPFSELCSLYNFYIRTPTSPTSGRSLQFEIRKNEADTPLVVGISGTGLSNNDTTNKLRVDVGDYVCVQSIPTNTPAVNVTQMGIVQFIPPKYPGLSLKLGPRGIKAPHIDNGLGLQRHGRSRVY